MAHVDLKKNGDTSATLTITVPHSDLTPFLEAAAKLISNEVKIDGFRPGHAPYQEIVKRVGEMAIYERALEKAVQNTFVTAVLEAGLETIGTPSINVTTLAPGNDLVYEATVSLLPHVKKLANWKNLSLKKEVKPVTDKDVDQALSDLSDMRKKEVRAVTETPVGDTDKVVVDLSMHKEGVPVEGGQSKGSFVFMDQESYLPGLKEALSGMKEGEEKVFSITFPEDHFQKHLAGQPVDVTARIDSIFHLERPVVDDAFAKELNFETLEALKTALKENIATEQEREEDLKFEREALETIAKESTFEELPKDLIENELQKMVNELHYNVTSQGLAFEDYLRSIKKTFEELKKDLEPQATLRLQIALVLKEIAKEEGINVSEEDLSAAIDARAEGVKDKETRDRIYSPEFRDYQKNILQNRAVIDLIKTTLL